MVSQHLQFLPGSRVHLIGIGGTGLSAIARVLLLRGCQVSGSDLHTNAETRELQRLGASIFQGHAAAHISGAEMIIASSAIRGDHVEITAARAQGIPVYKRADVLGAIMAGSSGIAIAGTHGKTTTTSMTVHALLQNGRDPGYIVGGVMANTGTNASAGSGEMFVIEADEYDNMFHGLRPQTAVVTSIEFDHPDFFKTRQELFQSFERFIGLLPADGLLIGCVDDPVVRGFIQQRRQQGLPVLSYGFAEDADWHVSDLRYAGDKLLFDIVQDGKVSGTVTLTVPGRHNALNATAALAAVTQYGVAFPDAAQALGSFRGTGRRFELRADIHHVAIIDDYAHHPTAIHTTIEAARHRYPDREIWAVWQPHTFSRTRELWQEFLSAFDQAQHVIVTDIYASREAFNADVSSADFVQQIRHRDCYHAPQFAHAVNILLTRMQAPAVVLIMSAGDAPQIGKLLLEQLEARS